MTATGRRARSQPWRAGLATRTQRRTPGASIRRSKKDRLFALGCIAAHSAHSRGVAVDLTVVRERLAAARRTIRRAHYGSCAGPSAARAPDNSLDMGTGYDCFDAKSCTRAAGLTAQQRARRAICCCRP